MIYRIQYWIIMFFRFIILLFPENARFKFAEFLGWLGYHVVKKRREIALANLKLAFTEKTQEERERIALESFKIMLKAFLCTLWFGKYLHEPGRVKIENIEILHKAAAENKGVVVSTLHLGNMEATVKAGEGYDITTVAKKQRNPYLDKFITESRKNDLNLTILKKSKRTSRELIERLNNKGIIALFSDHRDKGAIVNFFGESTKAPTGAVSLALKYDIPFVWGYNIMHKDNSCTIKVVEQVEFIKTDNFKEDVQVNTQLLISKMEEVIREYPEQWMWFHDRWNLYSQLHKKNKK